MWGILGQGDEFNIIVVDDAGTDDTERFMETYKDNPRITYIKKEKNGGVNSARNLAILQSKAEWVAFLDDDDEFLQDAIEIIYKRIGELPKSYNVAYFNSIIKTDNNEYVGGFQFKKEEGFYDPSYEETMLKFNLKGDCKPVFRRSLFENKKYLFPESVNGFESYTMNLLAKDNKGIRYFSDKTTLVHFQNEIKHISHTAPRKNPWPLFVLHSRQIPQHFWFYIKHPVFFSKKLITMSKLLLRSILIFFRSS